MRAANGAAVVVYHDSGADLLGCLEALSAAEGVGPIVVVDNASREPAASLVGESFAGRVELLALGENTGFAGGCNRGWALVRERAEWVAFMNPDVEVSAGCLTRAAAVLASDRRLAGVAPRLMRRDGETVDSVGQVLRRATLEVQDRGYGQQLTAALLEPAPVLAPCGALAVYRNDALEATADVDGPWAEHFFCFWEDLELGWRLTNSGWRIVAVPDAVALHSRGAGAEAGAAPLRWRRPAWLEACILSNRWMTMIRHLHALDLAARLPLLLVWDLSLVTAGIVRRPRLAGHLKRRWPLVRKEWQRRGDFKRRRLAELPW